MIPCEDCQQGQPPSTDLPFMPCVISALPGRCRRCCNEHAVGQVLRLSAVIVGGVRDYPETLLVQKTCELRSARWHGLAIDHYRPGGQMKFGIIVGAVSG